MYQLKRFSPFVFHNGHYSISIAVNEPSFCLSANSNTNDTFIDTIGSQLRKIPLTAMNDRHKVK